LRFQCLPLLRCALLRGGGGRLGCMGCFSGGGGLSSVVRLARLLLRGRSFLRLFPRACVFALLALRGGLRFKLGPQLLLARFLFLFRGLLFGLFGSGLLLS
jgi:hypothetical protein